VGQDELQAESDLTETELMVRRAQEMQQRSLFMRGEIEKQTPLPEPYRTVLYTGSFDSTVRKWELGTPEQDEPPPPAPPPPADPAGSSKLQPAVSTAAPPAAPAKKKKGGPGSFAQYVPPEADEERAQAARKAEEAAAEAAKHEAAKQRAHSSKAFDDAMAVLALPPVARWLKTFAGFTNGVTCLAVHDKEAGGGVLVAGSRDNTVQAWRTRTGERLHFTNEHSMRVSAVLVNESSFFSTSLDGCLLGAEVSEPLESRWRAVGEPLESRWRAVGEPLESRWIRARGVVLCGQDRERRHAAAAPLLRTRLTCLLAHAL
jgi:hypothetical protein